MNNLCLFIYCHFKTLLISEWFGAARERTLQQRQPAKQPQ